MFPPCIPEPLTQECTGEGERATDLLNKPEGGETNLATCVLVLVSGPSSGHRQELWPASFRNLHSGNGGSLTLPQGRILE